MKTKTHFKGITVLFAIRHTLNFVLECTVTWVEIVWVTYVCGLLQDGSLCDRSPMYSHKNQSHKNVSYQCLSAETVLPYCYC